MEGTGTTMDYLGAALRKLRNRRFPFVLPRRLVDILTMLEASRKAADDNRRAANDLTAKLATTSKALDDERARVGRLVERLREQSKRMTTDALPFQIALPSGAPGTVEGIEVKVGNRRIESALTHVVFHAKVGEPHTLGIELSGVYHVQGFAQPVVSVKVPGHEHRPVRRIEFIDGGIFEVPGSLVGDGVTRPAVHGDVPDPATAADPDPAPTPPADPEPTPEPAEDQPRAAETPDRGDRPGTPPAGPDTLTLEQVDRAVSALIPPRPVPPAVRKVADDLMRAERDRIAREGAKVDATQNEGGVD